MKSNDSFAHNLRSDFHMTQRTPTPVRFSDGLTGPCAIGVSKLKMRCGRYHVGRFQFNIAVSPSVVLQALVKTGGVYEIRQKEGRRIYDVASFGNGNGDDSRLGDSFSLYGGAVSRL